MTMTTWRRGRRAVGLGLSIGLTVAGLAGSAAAQSPGLGATLTTQDGGQIYGFDIDQAGSDGVLASARTIDDQGDVRVSVETFDQDTGAITKSFAKYVGPRNEYGTDGIFAGDVALITHYVTPSGSIYAKRFYDVMNPVTANSFTGPWTSPLEDVDVLQGAENQATATAVLLVIELKHADKPDIIVTDIARDTIGNTIHLDPNLFGLDDTPVLGQYTAANAAVIAVSPDAGAVGGEAPLNVTIDLTSGAMTQFSGYNNGPYHAGYVTGMAVDPNTGVEATATELNAQVEFYDLTKKKGIVAEQLPCTGDTDQLSSGSGIAVDPVNKLFLVTEQLYCTGSQGSAVLVYDETGKLIETITGFKFAIGEPAPVINPSKRMGWTFGPKFSQLQQFFY
jgi:hypothetical protein